MAVIGRDKNDAGLLIAHANDENFELPIVHAKLEFHDKDDNFVPVLTFCPIIDETKDEESQRRIADRLKSLIIDSIKFNIRIQWDPNGDLCALVIKDGKRYILPLPKNLILPEQPKNDKT